MAIREFFMANMIDIPTECKIVAWLKAVGDKVYKGETLVVVEYDKADMDVETFFDGYLAAIIVPAGGSVASDCGTAIALIAETEAEIEAAKQQAQSMAQPVTAAPVTTPSAPAPTTAAPVESKRAVVSPRARKLAKEYGVSVDSLNGTGSNGRITADDVSKATATALPPHPLSRLR